MIGFSFYLILGVTLKTFPTILLTALLSTFAHPADQHISIATVDSGFGGFFTAKAIEEKAFSLSQNYAVQFNLKHYGDTLHAPYGEKTPDEIAQFASQTIIKAHQTGAKHVFVACNTASSQFDKIQEILKSNPQTAAFADKTYSIIKSSVNALKNKINHHFEKHNSISIAILATPATIKSDIYPREIQLVLGQKTIKPSQYNFTKQTRWYQQKSLTIESGTSFVEFKIRDKTIAIYQIAPGNWVEMIEHQASQSEKLKAISSDLLLLTQAMDKKIQFDVVAEFCTHFPVFHHEIVSNLASINRTVPATAYIQQGEIFASIFKSIMEIELEKSKRTTKLSSQELQAIKNSTEPSIYISGFNQVETANLVKIIFPNQKNTAINSFNFK